MATRLTQLVSALLLTLTLSGAALLSAAAASANPPVPPKPADTVASVTAKLTALSQQNEALSEQLNLAIADVAIKQQTLAAAQLTAEQSAATYQDTRTLLTATMTAQYEGATNFSRTGALLTSTSGQDYADQLTAMTLLTTHRSDVLRQVELAHTAAQSAQKHASTVLAQAQTQQATLTAQQASLARDQQTYLTLLSTLTAEQRQTYTTANTTSAAQAVAATVTVHAATGAAQTAVDFAKAQVGKAYVFDAAGPRAFDCSGLTMVAYAHAGITLPHNAAEQYGYGTHVSYQQLQPGDLIFLYHPITHVEIYIGGGIAVSAADQAEGIIYTQVAHDMADYAGATRLT